jgi:acyl-CoA synthetase (AMP-forming)/AMP-acid ligase II
VPFKLLRRAAAEVPKQPAVIAPGRTDSYAELLTRSESLARGLQELRITRFGCSLGTPADTITALAGAAAVGSEACAYPPDLDAAGLSRIAASFDHRTLVLDDARSPDGIETVSLQGLMRADGPTPDPPQHAPVLILTTGTTGSQKGARHDWQRLASGVRAPDFIPGVRWLLAYNLNQFAGVQIMLHALASRATLVVPSSRRADDVISAIRDQGVTHISGTPTFWRLLVDCLRSDSGEGLGLEQITLGGEAAPERLIEQLTEMFPNARLSHVYAGTEVGSVVSVRDGRSGLPLSVLDRDASAEVRLRIVDDELEVRSSVGMLGYHNAGDSHAEWRRTGDLVEVRGDRIHFVGRTTEIINVGGAKVHPLPVEELVCSVTGVRLAAVYGRPNPVTGQIVAVDVVAEAGAEGADLEERIRAACEMLPAAGRPRRIRFVDELETRGSKLLRQAAR